MPPNGDLCTLQGPRWVEQSSHRHWLTGEATLIPLLPAKGSIIDGLKTGGLRIWEVS